MVVRAHIHLTNACYRSFRKRVTKNGCKVIRREATLDERNKSRDKRQSTLYVISVTCPIRPLKAGVTRVKAEEAATARQAKTAVSAKQKVEKEKREKEESECLAILHRAKVREEYASIVGKIKDDIEKTTISSSSNKR